MNIINASADMAVLINEINIEHASALKHAGRAIEHAKRAGMLLIEAKRRLPHGQWLPWLEANVSVSDRQAQRYMAAAKGKPTTVKAIKNDIVSHLPSWLPTGGKLAMCDFTADGCDYLMVHEVGHAPGYFYVVYISGGIETGGILDWTKRGILAAYVEDTILDFLPGKYTRRAEIGKFPWTYYEHENDFYDTYIKPHNDWARSQKAA